ncbi:hypothetical protein LAZ67_19002032 [Cordylochernes scorpioides]|uniref:Reverse transcriptase domain-containing protein n=1 Tax=Cordylochernes scorpioides TaxID=51811 RepID=A0ABY6LKR3_9ARAC|nr:hypothetical protein LAZ67_19002032 [Cordylochernes scorpioides]
MTVLERSTPGGETHAGGKKEREVEERGYVVDFKQAAVSRDRTADYRRRRCRISSVLMNPTTQNPQARMERTIMKRLKDRSDIMVCNSDKGSQTVVMDISTYRSKMMDVLTDESTFVPIDEDAKLRTYQDFRKALLEQKRLSQINSEEFKLFTSRITTDAYIYGLPKIHKPNVPLRPIVACHRSPSAPLARYLSNFFSPLLKQYNHKFTVHNTPNFIEELWKISPGPNTIMCSYDVVSLFLSLPHSVIRESIVAFLTEIQTDASTIQTIVCLADICLNMSVFKFESQTYRQIRGSPMGSSFSTVAAELVMIMVDKSINEKHRTDIVLWRRYVDDIFCVCDQSSYETILASLNSYNEDMSFTIEIAQGGIRNTAQYRSTCFIPYSYKSAAIARILNRNGVNTYFSNTLSLATKLKQTIARSSVTIDSLNTHNAIYSISCEQCDAKYVGETGRMVKTRMVEHDRSYGKINIAWKPCNPISQYLNQHKNTQLTERAGLIYEVKCEKCDQRYVGQTSRTLKERMENHKYALKWDRIQNSALVEHRRDTGHNKFNLENPRTLDYEKNYYKRQFKEAFFIQKTYPSVYAVKESGLALLIKNLYYKDIAVNISNTLDLEAQDIKTKTSSIKKNYGTSKRLIGYLSKTQLLKQPQFQYLEVEKRPERLFMTVKMTPALIIFSMKKINMKELAYALENTDLNKTPGPDGIHGRMISNLGKIGKERLLNIFNNSWKTGKLPQDCKNATIIPIKKLDKSADDPKHY